MLHTAFMKNTKIAMPVVPISAPVPSPLPGSQEASESPSDNHIAGCGKERRKWKGEEEEL